MTRTDIRAALERLVELNEECTEDQWTDAITAARTALAAEPVGEGPPAVTLSALLHPAYEPGDWSADGAQMVGMAWWHPVMGSDSLQIVVDNARNILRSRWGRPTAPPAPEPPAEALAARPIMEQVARLVEGPATLSRLVVISDRAANWLRDNPPGQPVAIKPRGCPTPGACSCVEPAPAAPEGEGEVGELVEWMQHRAAEVEADSFATIYSPHPLARAATLLQQLSAPAPAVVPVAVAERLPGEGDCDAEGRCWAHMQRRATSTPNWTLLWKGHFQPYHSYWLPAHALPLPQAGKGEG